MLYKIENRKWERVTLKNEIDIKEKIQEKKETYAAYISLETLETAGQVFAIPKYILQQGHRIDTSFRSEIKIEEDMMYGSVTVIDVMHLDYSRSQVFVVIKENYFLIVSVIDEKNMTEEIFQKAVKRYQQDAAIGKLIYAFFDALCQNGNETLEKMEKMVIAIEHELVENRVSAEVNRDIFLLKKRLLVLKNYYEQIVDTASNLKENEMEILKRPCHRFERLEEKSKRLSRSTQDICESVVHLREALDANLEYNLNRIMKVFTVVTTIFLPLTLIAGWYGMNFSYMPELVWKYGYWYVIVLSVLVVVISFIFFKWKKLL